MNDTYLREFYNNRFSDPEHYRGHHFFQHSRYSLENVLFVLKYIDKEKSFLVPPGDYKHYKKGEKYYHDATNYPAYNTLCVELKSEFSKRGSQFNSIKKHMFPDMDNMNLLARVKEGKAYRISLTSEGEDLLNEQHSVNTNMKWARAIGRAIESKSPTFLESLLNLLENVNYITRDEFAYFVSYLDYNDLYTYTEIAKMIEYSRISPKDFALMKEEFSNKSRFSLQDDSKPKSEKFDIGNFDNSTTSTWNYLQEMIYFQVNDVNGTVNLSIRDSITYNDQSITFKRNPGIKKVYNRHHKITENEGKLFDYHHIIPLFHVGTVEEKIILDKWENLICIDQNTHAVLTRSSRNNIVLSVLSEEIYLKDFLGIEDPIHLVNGKNAIFNFDTIKDQTSEYNASTLKQMNYID